MEMGFIIAVILITVAGLSTLIGSYYVILSKNKSHKKLGFMLGFASGVIISLVIQELLPESKEMLFNSFSYPTSIIILIGSLLLGLILSFALDKVLHHSEEEDEHDHCHMCNLGITTAIALAIHKIPEGMAIFIAISQDYLTAIPLALAIAIHHIPEGMMISAPIYYGTKDKKKALKYSLISGLVLPISGIVGYLFLMPFLNDITMGILLSITSSIMLFLAFTEIIPSSIKYSNKRTMVFSSLLGIIFIYMLGLI